MFCLQNRRRFFFFFNMLSRQRTAKIAREVSLAQAKR